MGDVCDLLIIKNTDFSPFFFWGFLTERIKGGVSVCESEIKGKQTRKRRERKRAERKGKRRKPKGEDQKRGNEKMLIQERRKEERVEVLEEGRVKTDERGFHSFSMMKNQKRKKMTRKTNKNPEINKRAIIDQGMGNTFSLFWGVFSQLIFLGGSRRRKGGNERLLLLLLCF